MMVWFWGLSLCNFVEAAKVSYPSLGCAAHPAYGLQRLAMHYLRVFENGFVMGHTVTKPS